MKDNEVEESIEILREVLIETKGMDRRAFLARLGAVAAATPVLTSFAGLAGVPGAANAATDRVTTIGWGGAWKDAFDKAYFDPFTANTGTQIQYISPYSFPKLQAMHDASDQQIDVVEAGGLDSIRIQQLGMDAPLDWNVIDKSVLSPGQLKYPNGIGAITLSEVLVYNKKKWPGEDHPKNWADFWNVEKFPGPRSMHRRANPVLEAALMADGVPADPAVMYPLDYDRAFKKLDELRPHIAVWWTSGSQQQQLIQDEEVDLICMWNGRASDSIINRNAHYKISWDQALYNGDVEAWFLLAGAPNPEGAMKLLDFVGRPEPQAVFAQTLFYGPTNMGAYDFIDQSLAEEMPSYPANAEKSFLMDYNWWSENLEEATKRFETWIQS